MSGPNANWRKPTLATKPWTTGFGPATMPPHCRRPASGWVWPRCKVFSIGGCVVCPRRSPQPSWAANTGIKWRSASSRFPIPCVFDRPAVGRMWFEGVIRDHLDVGRPDQIALIFHRRADGRTPGRFRTRVIQRGVDPTLCCYYKSSRIKQLFQRGTGAADRDGHRQHR
jgi:hypothetical protein